MDRKRKIQINVSPTGDDFQVIKCEASKCLGQDKDNKCDSALSGVTHHNGYRGKICDIWHRKGDERLFTDWLDELKKNSSLLRGREENLKVTPPYVVTHTCVVELIFRMCKDLKQPADTRYRTVELFDRFIANQFVELVKSVKKKQDQITEWDGIVENVSSNALLRVISCIQLASKYCAHSTIVPPKTALLYLTKRGLSVSVQNVLSSEARVFKSLNFDIGVPTLLVYVDTLLPLMRDIIHDKIYTVCINILDIIYLQRNHIFKNLSDKIIKNWTHSHSNKLKFSSYEFDGLFCGAATITTAVRIYYPNNKNTALMVNEKLANFIEKPADDILTFSNVILQTVGIQ